jgi:hypothetical protein
MPVLYPYLISSLPFLSFGAAPPFSYAGFLENCHGRIPEADYQLLEKISELTIDHHRQLQNTAIKEWFSFETALRNALVVARAGRRHKDPLRYLRQSDLFQASLEQLCQRAVRTPLLLEAEQMLDQARWDKLEELGQGHYFDLQTLIIYAYKLLILLRWEKIKRADSIDLLAEFTNHERGA